jgi:hypothetical protein
MLIHLQGGKTKKILGLTDNTMIVVEPTKRAKKNEFVFYKTSEHGGMGFERYKKIKHLECEVFAIVDIWNYNTKKILKKLYRNKK